MARTIKLDQFADELKDILETFSAESVEKAKKVCKKAAKYAKEELVSEARKIPVDGSSQMFRHTGLVQTGDYVNSMAYRKMAEGTYYLRYSVYVKAPHYRLTHLLEYGHQKVLWGVFTNERVKAYPHWQPADDAMQRMYEDELLVEMRHYDI